MRLAYFVSCFAVVSFFASTSPAFAQNYNVLFVPGGSIGGPPVPQDPDVTKNTREEIVVAANRDLNADTYYNKAGATLDDYYHDWQICRLIARGSTDNIPGTAYVYSGSPLAAGIGGALGVAIGAGIREEAVRQANRENCLLIKGWRVIRPSTRVGARITLSKGKAREAFLSNLVGEVEPLGKIVRQWQDRVLQPDPMLNLDAQVPGHATLWLGKGVDPTVPLELAEGKAAVVLAFRRPDKGSAGRSASLRLWRYDPESHDLIRTGASEHDTLVHQFDSKDRKAPYEIQVAILTPGYYVIDNVSVAGKDPSETFCFGAPLIRVPEGKVTYIGDWIPYKGVKLSTGKKLDRALALTDKLEETRAALRQFQPTLAEGMVPMAIGNGATYSCGGHRMTKWGLAGIPAIENRAAPAEERPDANEEAQAPGED